MKSYVEAFDLTGKNALITGGGTGLGVRMTPIAFLVIKGESVRMLPIAAPVSCTADRVVEQLPDLVDKLCAMFHHEGKEEDGQG